MTVALTGAGGLFTRLGLLAGGLDDLNAMRGGAATARVLSGARVPTRIALLDTAYGSSPLDPNVIDGIYTQLAAFQGAQASMASYYSTIAQNTILEMVNDDAPQAARTLTLALQELIRQMNGTVDVVEASVVAAGAQTAVGSPSGNAVIVTSTKAANGVSLAYALAETLKFRCTQDSQNGATLAQEPVAVTGKPLEANALNYLWPGGSGANTAVAAVNAALNNSGGNKLSNSDFETFTVSNQADLWTYVVGVVTTNFLNGTSDAYTGSGCLRVLGAGGTLACVRQKFNAAGTGTAGTVLPLTQYAVQFRTKVSAAPSAGVLRVALVDASGTVINDAAGTANSFTVDLTAETTAYLTHSGTFRLPAVLPSEVWLEFQTTTAIDNAKSLFLDRVGFNAMTALYTGGPFASIFSGSAKLILNDTWTVAITNTMGLFQAFFERAFGMRALGLQLPEHATQTINDSLIT